MSWFGHRGCLASHQTTWVDLPCCYWLNLKLQVDFASLAIQTKLYILGAENTVLKVWWVTRSKSKVSRPLFSLVLEAGDMICFVVKSENSNEKGSVKQTNLCPKSITGHSNLPLTRHLLSQLLSCGTSYLFQSAPPTLCLCSKKS